MDNRPVFVLLTAKTCGACHRFKNTIWDDLKKELERQGKVQIVTIDVPTTTSKPDPTKYHKSLHRFIGWWPTMSLFPADRWYNHNSELVGIVKNGKLVPPKEVVDKDGKKKTIPEHVEPVVGKFNLSKEDILRWIDYTLSNDRIFTRNRRNPVPVQSHQPQSYQPPRHQKKLKVPTLASYHKFQPSSVP